MSITKKDVKNIEMVGNTSDGSEVYLVESKGGLHQMLKKRKKGDFQTLGQGNHRAVARVMANQMEKNISWHESLFKSEDAEFLKKAEKENKIIPDSTTEAHIAQAVWHTSMQHTSDALNKIYHGLKTISHYQAAGLDKSKAIEAATNTLKKLNKSYTMDMPYDEALLCIAWEKKNGKSFPSGE